MADSEGDDEPYHGNNHELGSRRPGQLEKRHLKADDDEDVQNVGGLTGGGQRLTWSKCTSHERRPTFNLKMRGGLSEAEYHRGNRPQVNYCVGIVP